MKRWFYVDIVTTSHMRIAVKARDGEAAKDIAGAVVDGGVIDPTDTRDYPYGSSSDSITVGDPEPTRPPRGMYRFDGVRRLA